MSAVERKQIEAALEAARNPLSKWTPTRITIARKGEARSPCKDFVAIDRDSLRVLADAARKHLETVS